MWTQHTDSKQHELYHKIQVNDPAQGHPTTFKVLLKHFSFALSCTQYKQKIRLAQNIKMGMLKQTAGPS